VAVAVLCVAAAAALGAFLLVRQLSLLFQHTQLLLVRVVRVVRAVQSLLILVHQVQVLFLVSIQPLAAAAAHQT
jgi:hypothetical protein